MEGLIGGAVLAVAGTVAVVAYIAWVRHTAPEFETVAITVATGETPEQIIDRVFAALLAPQRPQRFRAQAPRLRSAVDTGRCRWNPRTG